MIVVSAARESYSETRREGGGKMRSAVAKAPEATGAPADGCTALPSSGVGSARSTVVLLFYVHSAQYALPMAMLSNTVIYTTVEWSHLFRALLAF